MEGVFMMGNAHQEATAQAIDFNNRDNCLNITSIKRSSYVLAIYSGQWHQCIKENSMFGLYNL